MTFRSFFILFLSLCSYGFAEIYDVVIVGGGVSGTYCAYRLTEEAKLNEAPKKICLLEASNRIGGRLFSMRLPEQPDFVAELGGMRFFDKQKNVNGLVDHLMLETTFFAPRDSERFMYTRRVRLTKNEYSKLPYNLRENEKGKSPDELVEMAIYTAYPTLKGMEDKQLREYLRTAKFQDVPLWQVGFWNFLATYLSSEAFNCVRDLSGYYSDYINWNAYDAIVYFFYVGTDTHFKTLKEGFDSLPKKMAEIFVSNGGELKLNHEVTILDLETVDGEQVIQVKTKEKDFYARHVILALPKRAIELLNCKSFIFKNPSFIEDLQRVTGIQASKIFLWYDKEWWTKLGFSFGDSSTDLPMRRCYYFQTEKNGNQARKGLLMASYGDAEAVDFWEGFLPNSAFYFIKELFTTKEEYIKKHTLPPRMLNQVTNEISEVHGISVPLANHSLFQNWGNDLFGAAWHMWNPFNQSWIVMPRIRHPFKEINLYICGEAYSREQAWVEGALNTAELTLQQYFSLQRAPWLPETYDLGN